MMEQYWEGKNIEELQRDSQFFSVLCRDYTSVFYANLLDGTAEMFKVEQGANANNIFKDTTCKNFNYMDMLLVYAKNYVVRTDRQKFIDTLSVKNIIKELQRKERLSLRYKSIPNDNGQKNFEVQVIRLQEDKFDYKVLMGFRRIDELAAAEQANAAKTEFLSQVAHDIRTPLNAILGFVEIAKNQLDDKEQIAYALDKITSSGKYLSELVNDVLDLSKIEKGQMAINPEKISLTDFFAKFSPLLQLRKPDKVLNVSYRQHDIVYDCVMVDPIRLRQVCTNLISNAMKYTPSGGSIDVEVYEETLPDTNRVRLVFKISDTGIGMSKEFMKHMYARFTRATDIRISNVNGHGLGLAIVKDLVDLLGGKIEVTSEVGKGTSFLVNFVLPVIVNEDVQAKQQHFDYEADCRGMHLLVAEDNKLNYEVVSLLLAMHGITCERAIDGAMCVEKFLRVAAHTYDAILMDMQMPSMDGIMATRAIRQSSHPQADSIPIIAMTANAFSDDIKKCLDAGMQAHLSKPLNMPKLLWELSKYR